jgi:4,5-DOPA dioxygenase extradiol
VGHRSRHLVSRPADVARLDGHRDFRHAVPTPDHFIPLLYLAGLADAAGHATDIMVDGYAYGSLSMTSYTLDHPGQRAGGPAADSTAGDGAAGDGTDGGPGRPAPADAPPDESNI